MVQPWIKPLFLIAAAYDFFLGVLFLIAAPAVFEAFGITPPNHYGYVHFSAGVVATFGIGFWFVSRNPLKNVDIIKMGVLLKLTYCLTVFYHQLVGSIPWIWIPFAWFDAIFCVLFGIALSALANAPEPAVTG